MSPRDSDASVERFLRPAFQPVGYRDGHARPRALAVDARDGVIYVALSTADAIAVVKPAPTPSVLAVLPVCAFPDALAALPEGGVLVSCRFDPALRMIRHPDAGTWTTSALPAAKVSGARGLAISPDGTRAYVASPPQGGVTVVALPSGQVTQQLATGRDPRTLRWVPAGALPRQTAPLLLVTDFVGHAVTVHEVAADGALSPARQTLRTEAPVLDLWVEHGGSALWLFTHEDRPLSREHGPVEGLDSVALSVPFAAKGPAWFADPRPLRRDSVNFSDRRGSPVVELAAATTGDGLVAVVGAGTDNLWFGGTYDLMLATSEAGRAEGVVVPVGTHPVAVAALGGGRFVTADHLSDTLTFVATRDAGGPVTPVVEATVSLAHLAGAPTPGTVGGGAIRADARRFAADVRLGEQLFYSTALVPHNVATGPLSLYTCAACHDDGHIDGRRHPSKKNRFFSMTKTCRGLAVTPPFLSLGEPTTLESFADNIVATHAQGAEKDPQHFDEYPVDLRVFQDAPADPRWQTRTLSPPEVRRALAAYMASIPPEPSPFVPPGAKTLSPIARRGLALFKDSCAGCHQLVGSTARANVIAAPQREARLLAGQVALTSPESYDVGTPVLGKDGNNPPSLRGVWANGPYFSDGSAPTLEDVLRRTNPHAPKVHASANAAAPAAFSDADREALAAFLRSL